MLALADVLVDIDGIEIEINSIRLEREAYRVSVRLPVDRDNRALIVVPDPVRDAIADVVLAAGLEQGIVLERTITIAVGAAHE
ncbi:hypothetical protein [Magnetospirillum sp. UT-4]|uniref:hypothetical protein n=1 Tax=Magnetospirillum sp. UT-4 TaxID=2681467 RepID=UPI00137D6A52|nr:hypothetical protein [Magnetospirillum sp. UT-4]CAA7626707.1 conserved hypothetical protein [Magnetospirillum sp. UT-4]